VPVRAESAERLLAGQEPGAEALRAAADAVAAATDPIDDIHAPAGYRRRIAAVLARRCLQQAVPPAQRRAAA